MQVELYIFSKLDNQYKQVDLYGDETITIESSLQDIRAIESTNTDYSQNFKVPATPNNESLFKHWYDSSIVNGFDNRSDIDALLYVDGELFRRGVILINSVQALRDSSLFYDITFFGRLRKLLDKFLNNKLREVSALDDIIYNRDSDDYIDAVFGDNSLDVMYPLICTSGSWAYGTGSLSFDISTPQGAIDMDKINPAVKLTRIFEALESEYELSFTGSFLEDDRFTKAYVLFAGDPAETIKTTPLDLTFPNGTINIPYFQRNSSYIQYLGLPVSNIGTRMRVNFIGDPSTTWQITPFLNFGTINTKTGVPLPIIKSNETNRVIFNDTYTPGGSGFEGLWDFQIQVSNALPFEVELILEFIFSGVVTNTNTLDSGIINPTSNLSLRAFAPDILVTDFLKGILNMWNLSLYSIREEAFEIEPLREWYEKGTRYNIDPYVRKDYTYEAVPVYNKIDFKYKESKAILNNLYRNSKSAGIDYGILDYANPEIARGGDIDVSIPFENLLFQKVVGSVNGPKVAYLLDNTLKPFVPGVVMLYHTGLVGRNGPTLDYAIDTFYVRDNSGILIGGTNYYNEFSQELTVGYTPIGQFIGYDGTWYSLNFGSEAPITAPSEIENTLFNEYYKFRIDTVFDQRTRLLKVEAKLPSQLLNALELNDSLIIEGQAYQINTQTTDLYTGITTFELLSQRYLSPIPGPTPANCLPFNVYAVFDGITGLGTMEVILTLDPSSSTDIGPFIITANVGSVLPAGNPTRAQLLAGYSIYVDPDVTLITLTSNGGCTNSITVPVTGMGCMFSNPTAVWVSN